MIRKASALHDIIWYIQTLVPKSFRKEEVISKRIGFWTLGLTFSAEANIILLSTVQRWLAPRCSHLFSPCDEILVGWRSQHGFFHPARCYSRISNGLAMSSVFCPMRDEKPLYRVDRSVEKTPRHGMKFNVSKSQKMCTIFQAKLHNFRWYLTSALHFLGAILHSSHRLKLQDQTGSSAAHPEPHHKGAVQGQGDQGLGRLGSD